MNPNTLKPMPKDKRVELQLENQYKEVAIRKEIRALQKYGDQEKSKPLVYDLDAGMERIKAK